VQAKRNHQAIYFCIKQKVFLFIEFIMSKALLDLAGYQNHDSNYKY
jgi:hypothetical protein